MYKTHVRVGTNARGLGNFSQSHIARKIITPNNKLAEMNCTRNATRVSRLNETCDQSCKNEIPRRNDADYPNKRAVNT